MAIGIAGCDLVLPLPEPHLAEEAGWHEDDEQDAFAPDANVEAATADATVDTGADADDGDAGSDSGSNAIENPCPNRALSCCGFDADAGTSGKLYCRGSGRISPGVCDTCLALGCNPDLELCCAPGGDNPAFCLDLAHGALCDNSN